MSNWELFGALVVAAVWVIFLMYVAADIGERCKIGASNGTTANGADRPGPRIQTSHSRASCVGRTGGTLPDEGRDTFPREWVLTSARPFDQDAA